jgi:predicted transcriptional regulator
VSTETTPLRIPVAAELEPELAARLDAKRAEADRSRAAEIRQAIRAWVGEDDSETSATQEASAA